VTWQATSFLFIGLVIAGGFWWYERSRPSSRTVALVAGLAALAVAGRLVLAPVPNVVATTDIALITGFALGGAPGFAVGALAAPVSNLWLGQGPWTPWQMAGWGLCGLLGAALAVLTRRRVSRLGLACACAFAGFAYGALLDLSVMVTYGGEQSLDRYLALSARGLPFNIAHAAGNFAIALAAGPALVRMISRFRERLEFTWTSGAAPARAGAAAVLALVVSLLVLALGPGGPQDARARQEAASGTAADGRAWLERAQNHDGGFGTAPGSSSNAGMTGWAMLGLEAAGRNPLDLRRDGNSPVDYLRGRAERLNSSADLERTILALAGAGISPYGFGGQNLVAELRAKRDADGSFDGNVNSTSFAVFALRSVSAPASELERSATWIRRAQNRDGGWGFRRGTASDADSTGAALQALDAAGGGGSAASKGVRYLRGAQLGDGGFPLASGGASNSQSTAWASQGLVASGVAPASVTSGGSSPLDYLAARQAPDGHYRYSAATDQTPVWVTSQALLAVNRRAFPLGRVPKVGEPGALPPPAEPSGSGGGQGGAAGGSGGGSATGPDGGNGGGPSSAGKGDAGKGDAEKAGGNRPAEAELASADVPAGAEQLGGGGSSNDATPYVLAGLGALALALGGGFLWYRRQLP
jgi:energy-coupling factor transport system substrate-specific component